MSAILDAPVLPTYLKGRDFLNFLEYSPEELQELLTLAAQLKQLKRSKTPHKLLEGRSVAMYFEKPSNRTRVSFEVGIFDLGAHPFMLRKEEINLGVRETIADTARTLARYVDCVMIRTFAHQDVEELAQWSDVPIINGLTDDYHPCQVLADLLTVQEKFGNLKGRKLTYVGDGNNMAHSLMLGCAMVGMDVTIASPSGYQPQPEITKKAQELGAVSGATVVISDDVKSAVKNASAVYTDVWASMGQEAEAEARKKVFREYQVNAENMALALPEAIVLHCLPAHRGEEITAEVLEKHADIIFEQAENRLHAQKAVLAAIIK
ncbi:ornithine carbamoyltransferase [Vampirovibrio sp.]|uniref:ornithine carbamoyltransferase n=1 Tax=Vampirovibrio sp. TaxID=2717857 RepID=UPI003593037F